jgi:hypothetical protein
VDPEGLGLIFFQCTRPSGSSSRAYFQNLNPIGFGSESKVLDCWFWVQWGTAFIRPLGFGFNMDPVLV